MVPPNDAVALGSIIENIQRRLEGFIVPELQSIKETVKLVEMLPGLIAEQTIIVNENRKSLTTIIANVGNITIPDSLWGHMGIRGDFNSGYQLNDVTAKGPKKSIKVGSFNASSILNSPSFVSGIVKILPGPGPGPGPGPIIPLGGTAPLQEPVLPVAKDLIPVNLNIDTFKFSLFELFNSRLSLKNRKAFVFMGAVARRLDDINTKMTIFADLEGVAKNIGERWGYIDSMISFLNGQNLTPSQFASNVWNVQGAFGNRIRGLIPQVQELDFSLVGNSIGTSRIPINLDRLWDGNIIPFGNTSSMNLKGRVNALIGDGFDFSTFASQFSLDFLGTPLKNVEGKVLKVWEGIRGNGVLISGLRGSIVGNSGLIAGIREQFGTRPRIFEGQSIWGILDELKKKLTEFKERIQNLLPDITSLDTILNRAKGNGEGLLSNTKTKIDDFKFWLNEKPIKITQEVKFESLLSKRERTYEKTYIGFKSLIKDRAISDFGSWIDSKVSSFCHDIGGCVFGENEEKLKWRAKFVRTWLSKVTSEITQIFNLQNFLSLDFLNRFGGINTDIGSGLGIVSRIKEVAGGGGRLGLQSQRQTSMTQPKLMENDKKQNSLYEVHIN